MNCPDHFLLEHLNHYQHTPYVLTTLAGNVAFAFIHDSFKYYNALYRINYGECDECYRRKNYLGGLSGPYGSMFCNKYLIKHLDSNNSDLNVNCLKTMVSICEKRIETSIIGVKMWVGLTILNSSVNTENVMHWNPRIEKIYASSISISRNQVALFEQAINLYVPLLLPNMVNKLLAHKTNSLNIICKVKQNPMTSGLKSKSLIWLENILLDWKENLVNPFYKCDKFWLFYIKHLLQSPIEKDSNNKPTALYYHICVGEISEISEIGFEKL